jgi:3-oxoacyl-[acyl-carrier-protein] synthase II
MQNNRRVVITGMGVVSPFGLGINKFKENLFAGKSAAHMITDFDVSELPTRFAASISLQEKELDSMIENQKSLKTMSRAMKFAIISAHEAVKASKLQPGKVDPYRLGISMGAGGLGLWDLDYSKQLSRIIYDSMEDTNGEFSFGKIWKNVLERVHPLTPLKALPNMAAANIAINYNARGHCQTITTACTSGTQAIGEAYRLIKHDIADVMIAGASDSMINPNGLVAFSTLGVMSKNNNEYSNAIRPFDKRRDGFMIGEGGAMFVLEEQDHCLQRGAEPLAEVIGYSSINDAFRLTDEPPQAWGSIKAMRLAMEDALINPEQIDYINAHGTGTVMNDKTETVAIKSVFGKFAYEIPISSTKSMIGHLVAAAGAVELTASVLALCHQRIPPTINYQEYDPECDLDYVPNISREKKLEVVLSNSFGFGGQNACLVIRKVNKQKSLPNERSS